MNSDVKIIEGRPVIGAPQWLKDRQAANRKHVREHPPTVEQVRRIWQASADQLSRNPYKDVDYIR